MIKFSHFILNLLFPPVCLSCDKIGDAICLSCYQKFKLLDFYICPFCLHNSTNGTKHKNCKGNVDGLFSIYKYNKILQKIIKNIKYRFYYSALNDLLDLYLKDFKKIKNKDFYTFIKTKPIIIPIPLHRERLKYRGFNQSQIIGKIFANKLNLSVSTKIIQRTKNTLFQSELNKVQRQLNIKNAFSSNLNLNKIIILKTKKPNALIVDDVWTTGGTCQEAAKILKSLGFNQIWVLTLAR